MLINRINNVKRPYILGVCFIVVILVTVFVYFKYFSDKSEDLKDNYNTSHTIEFTFKEEDKEYWIVNLAEDKTRWLFVDGKQSSMISALPTSPTPHITLPKTRKANNFPLLEEDKHTDSFTLEATLEQSAEYVNYLKKQGYSIVRQVQARNYIELIMSNNSEKLKRIIVQERTIMVGEVEKTTSLPKLEDYLSSYKITGGELNE